jgi:hypothetical protein
MKGGTRMKIAVMESLCAKCKHISKETYWSEYDQKTVAYLVCRSGGPSDGQMGGARECRYFKENKHAV